MNILECKQLGKSYRKGTPVLSGLSIAIPEGKIVGLLGPNGCGKSTLIKLIAGLLKPDIGEILVCGNEIGEKSKALIAYLPDQTYFNSWMRVEELVMLFDDFYEDFDPSRAFQLLSDLNINPKFKLKALSKGTQEKVQLILVMSRNAKLYLLDEPIAGVDPAAREYILNTIMQNHNPDATIIITTHLISDIESVLDNFIFMTYGGRILMTGNAKQVHEEQNKTIDQLFREVFRCYASF